MMQDFIMRPYRAFILKFSIFLVVLSIAGCSAIRLGYANGENVVFWWLNGYVDINAQQQSWVKKHISDLFIWHHKTQLHEYARLFAHAQQRLPHPVTPADILSEYATLKNQAQLIADKALPGLTDLALSLEAQQIAHIEKKFASNNEKYRKDYLRGELEQRQLFRYKKVMKHAEYWFGDFTPEQEAKIRAASDARPLNNELWLAERMRRQNELISILKKIHDEQPGREAAMTLLKNHRAASLELIPHAEHQAFFDASIDGTAQLAALIINLATPEQKAHATKKLQKWIDDCRTLAAQGGI